MGGEPQASRYSVVDVGGAKSGKRSGVMPDNLASHLQGDRGLPGVVRPHFGTRSPLKHRHAFGVGMVQALPSVACQVSSHKINILGTLQHLGHGHRADPQPRLPMNCQPTDGRTRSPVGQLIEEINEKGRIEQNVH
jgi:hypothetical protein